MGNVGGTEESEALPTIQSLRRQSETGWRKRTASWSTHTEASLVMILRLARAKKHLWTLAWFNSGGRARSLAVDIGGTRSDKGGRNVSWRGLLTFVRFLRIVHQGFYHHFDLPPQSLWRMRKWKSGDKGNSITYMVGSAKFQRERVYHFLNFQLVPVSGPERDRMRENKLLPHAPVSPSRLAFSWQFSLPLWQLRCPPGLIAR